jgi:hypothetical protein
MTDDEKKKDGEDVEASTRLTNQIILQTIIDTLIFSPQ